PVELDVEPLGGKEAFLVRDEVVKPHALRGDSHGSQAVGHGAILLKLVLARVCACRLSSAIAAGDHALISWLGTCGGAPPRPHYSRTARLRPHRRTSHGLPSAERASLRACI